MSEPRIYGAFSLENLDYIASPIQFFNQLIMVKGWMGKQFVYTKRAPFSGGSQFREFSYLTQMETFGKYILDDHIPVAVYDLWQWAEWFEKSDSDRIVKQENVGDLWVSTLFLGIDLGHSRLSGPGYTPQLFETMVFREGKALFDYTKRYATWAAAEHGHQKTVEECLNNLKENAAG